MVINIAKLIIRIIYQVKTARPMVRVRNKKTRARAKLSISSVIVTRFFIIFSNPIKVLYFLKAFKSGYFIFASL